MSQEIMNNFINVKKILIKKDENVHRFVLSRNFWKEKETEKLRQKERESNK